MLSVILFILTCVGATQIIVREGAFERQRAFVNAWFPYSILNSILRCETCTGTWVGLILALALPELGLNWFVGAMVSAIANKTYALFVIKVMG